MNQNGLFACVVAVVTMTIFGVSLGSSAIEKSAIEKRVTNACTLQGSFVIDGKVYDCTPRAKQ